MSTRIGVVILLLVGAMPLPAETINLPPVQASFSKMHPGVVAGLTIREIIPPESVRLIALTEDRGRGEPLGPNFKPDGDPNQIIRQAFASDARAREWGLRATESTLVRYSIVTRDGRLFLLDVLGDILRNLPVTAIILRGNGFGCRFEMALK